MSKVFFGGKRTLFLQFCVALMYLCTYKTLIRLIYIFFYFILLYLAMCIYACVHVSMCTRMEVPAKARGVASLWS